MIIGTFSYDPFSDTFGGDLSTLTVQRRLAIVPVEKQSEKTPDYKVLASTDDGAIQIGFAWKLKSAPRLECVAVRLDDPAFPSPIECRLLEVSADDRDFVLSWQRQVPDHGRAKS